jgi:hypothetical protein
MMERIRAQVAAGLIDVTRHAWEAMADEGIASLEMLQALRQGSILEDYPTHRRGACCLVCGYTADGSPLHVVCTTSLPFVRVITVYVPRLPWWVTPTQRRAR